MAEPGPPPPPRLDLRLASAVLRRSSATFTSSALLPLLAASLLILAFRSALLAGTLHLTAVVDRDPAVRSLLSRLSAADNQLPDAVDPPRRRRPPFLHLTRVGTLDDDFFDAASDRRPSPRPQFNSTSSPIRLFLGFPKTTPKSLNYRLPDTPASSPIFFAFPEERPAAAAADNEIDRAIEIRIFGRGLDLGRQDAVVILYLLSLLSSTHTLAIVGFILSYTCALGIVFLAVTRSHLRKPAPLLDTVYWGARLGIRRLKGSVFLRWAARDAAIQFLCICFFSDISDQVKLFKLFVRVKLMPFSLTAPFPLGPWFAPLDEELSAFLYAWAVLDVVSSVVLAVNPFVVIMDYNWRRRGSDVMKEGFYLVSLMLSQAIWIKCLEAVVCGTAGRSVLMMIGGRMFAIAVQSVAEVYFMVAWLVLYFAARSKDGELEGRRFGRGDMEDSINGLR